MSFPSPARPTETPLRVLLVDDSALFRQGLATLLGAAGLDVVAELGTAGPLVASIKRYSPQVVVLDARMPPTHTDEGIRAALQVRHEFPRVGVLILSTYAEGVWANQLFSAGSAGLGYLLKDRVNNTSALIEAIRRVEEGGTVVDPEVIERLLSLTSRRSILDKLSQRERDVLSLMAEGRSNAGIGRSLHLSPRTVEAYIAAIFTKLPLATDDSSTNRRVLAVLTYLQQSDRP
jgi:DNA-binding NarL/FixJ family response regulator